MKLEVLNVLKCLKLLTPSDGMVDVLVSKTSAERRVGSNPTLASIETWKTYSSFYDGQVAQWESMDFYSEGEYSIKNKIIKITIFFN